MKLHIFVIQYDCGALCQSGYKGLVKNIKNKTFTEIKYHGKTYAQKLPRDIIAKNIWSKKSQKIS